MRKPATQSVLVARFWAKVDMSGECWVWTGAKHPDGYGHGWDGKRTVRAHRYSYEMEKGPIPEGMQVDHICHNRACVRPDHLRLATNKQNGENLSGPNNKNTSGVRGVSWNKVCKKWQGYVRHNGKRTHVGLFEDLSEAEAAVKAKRNALFTHNNLDRVA